MHGPPKATRREWVGLAVIALPTVVCAIDLTVLNLALPRISAQLQPSGAQLLWIVDIYSFLVAGFLVTMGTLGDRIGRRRLLLIGAGTFGAASAMAAFSSSANALIAMRALLGIAAATFAPSAMSMIREMFVDVHERRFAIAVWIASFSLGVAIGSPAGGLLLESFHWGSVFIVAVPVMALTLWLGPKVLPDRHTASAKRFDLPSVTLSLVAVLATIYALKHLADHGLAWRSAAAVALGLIAGVSFVRRQRRLEQPLLDLRLFRCPLLRAAVIANALTCLALFGVLTFISPYLQVALALSPLEAGLATLPWALALVVGSLMAPRLMRRLPRLAVLSWGLATASIGLGLLAAVGGVWALPVLIAGMVIFSLGVSPVFTICNEIVISGVPEGRAGASVALSETVAELGTALGVALFGIAGAATFRGVLIEAMPAGVTPEAARAAVATMGGAWAVAQALPAETGAVLLAVTRNAVTDALRVSALAASATVMAAGLALFTVIRIADGPTRELIGEERQQP